MKLQSLLIAFGVLLEAHRSCGVDVNYEQVRFILNKFRLDIPKRNESSWERGVRESYIAVVNILEQFPEKTYEIGKTLVTSYKTLVDHLDITAKQNSTISSKGSEETLKALSLQSKLGQSMKQLMNEFRLVLPKVSAGYRDIVWTLSAIGDLGEYINKDISILESSIVHVLDQFKKRYEERKQDRCEKIDIDQMVWNLRILLNTLAIIAETALTDCGCFTYSNDVFEALKVVALIVYHLIICVQGTGANVATELVSEKENIPSVYNLYFQAMDPTLKAIAKSISTTTADNKKFTRDVLTKFVEVTKSLNRALEPILGPFKGCKISVAHIKKNLAKSQGN